VIILDEEGRIIEEKLELKEEYFHHPKFPLLNTPSRDFNTGF
jgi:hypothetical protein